MQWLPRQTLEYAIDSLCLGQLERGSRGGAMAGKWVSPVFNTVKLGRSSRDSKGIDQCPQIIVGRRHLILVKTGAWGAGVRTGMLTQAEVA